MEQVTNRPYVPRLFIRYCCVGVLGTLIDVCSLWLLVEIADVRLQIAVTVSFILAASSNFLLNKIWTYKDTSTQHARQYLTFMGVSIVGLGLTWLCMFLFVTKIGIWYIAAKLITSALVLAFNFTTNTLITFSHNRLPCSQSSSLLTTKKSA